MRVKVREMEPIDRAKFRVFLEHANTTFEPISMSSADPFGLYLIERDDGNILANFDGFCVFDDEDEDENFTLIPFAPWEKAFMTAFDSRHPEGLSNVQVLEILDSINHE